MIVGGRVGGSYDKTVSVKDISRNVEALAGVFCCVIIPRNAIAYRVEEKPPTRGFLLTRDGI
jgi:hypothetical protein